MKQKTGRKGPMNGYIIQADLSKSYVKLKRPHDRIKWQTKSNVDQNIIKGSCFWLNMEEIPQRHDITGNVVTQNLSLLRWTETDKGNVKSVEKEKERNDRGEKERGLQISYGKREERVRQTDRGGTEGERREMIEKGEIWRMKDGKI